MAVPAFNEYTYKISYKIGSSDEIILSEELVILVALTSEVIDGNVVQVQNPNYDYFMNTLSVSVAPVDGATLFIRRNKIMDGEIVVAEEKLVHQGAFSFPDYDTRQSLVITDTEVNGSTSHTILVQILNVVGEERIPCNYTLPKLEFAAQITDSQHVDIQYKQVGATDYITLGTNVIVSPTGKINNISLGQLPDDTEYLLRIYHYEMDEEKFFLFHTNLIPTLGINPIIGKVEWNGRIVLLDAPNVKARMYPSPDKLDWMFPMDYSTKSFDNILSSLWTSDDYLGKNENYHFEMRTSTDNPEETYIGCAINKDHYIGLPFDYVNDKLPDQGASMNIFYKDLFTVSNPATDRNAIIMKFYADPTHVGPLKLLGIDHNSEQDNTNYLGFNFNKAGDCREVNVFGKIMLTSSIGDPLITSGKWYTLLLVTNGNKINYLSISDYSNYSQTAIPINAGAHVGNVDLKNKLYNADRLPVTIEITYDCTQYTPEIGLCIDYATYQYIEDNDINNQIEKGNSIYKSPEYGTGKKITVTIPNESAYGIAVGYSLGFLKGGTTVAGKVTITDFKVNGVSIFSDLANYPFKVDEAVSAYISGTKTDIIWAKTGYSLPTPIGGTVFEDVELNQNIELNARLFVGCPVQSGDMTNASYVVSRIGLHKSTITGTDSWDTPYQYIDPTVMEALGAGYKKMPKLKCTNDNGTVTVIPTSEMTEMKDATVRFLLEGLPIGKTRIEVESGEDILSSVSREIKSIKLTPAQADYDINFEGDFDAAVTEFKKRYYAKQKRWGGNMGGGTNGNLIYFNRGLKCLILEQHGDKYRGIVPAVAPAGANGYGLPVDLVENPLNYIPNTSQRTSRVGGLIQSVDYHPYGMFDCWFKVPKGMIGLAICLWYFHYQEIYNYDKTFKFWTETGVKGYTYADSVKSGYGATWVVINNEIDMELGSENTPYRTVMNPNSDTSIMWYVPGLSYRQAIGCTATGADYGTWMIDWEASKAAIDAVTETDPQNSASYLRSNQLKWVKIMDTIDEVNYGANVRSCRFNNWMNEAWNDGCGVYGTIANSQLGKGELSVNNRTPLGDIDPKAVQQSARYVEKYYDDGQYHKWSIDWKGDYTALYIDDEPIAICKAFVPFNPMTMLVGCWFPSGNAYDKNVLLGEWGTWSGVHADWEIGLMQVKRIKFKAYTEEEAPTTDMRYDCETYAEDGLREIL